VRICLILNPTARGERARRFQRQLERIWGECAVKLTVAPGSARQLATEAVREGFQTVVAAGGDGTVNEVLNGIAEANGGLDCARLGVLPLGTINVFAKQCGIPTHPGRAWDTIIQGKEKSIDVARVDFAEEGQNRHRLFVQLAGAGLDSRAIHLVDWETKKRFGPLAYILSGLKALQGEQPLITISDGERSTSGELVLIGNGSFYGGRFVLFPRASNQDGVLDACAFSRVHWRDLAARGFGLLTQTLAGQRGITHLQGRVLTVTSPAPVLFEVEGENVGSLPAKFSVAPKALRVIVP
jgi:diacylglycerol kinase (ATP)